MAEDRERTPATSSGEPAALYQPLPPAGAPDAHALLRPGDPGDAAYPIAQAEYWREMHRREPYYQQGRSFMDYSTAYELGWVSYHRWGGEFDTAERVLQNDWQLRKGVSSLSWDEARPAVRAAWQRAENVHSCVTDGTASPEVVRQALADLFATVRDVELILREALSQAQVPELVAVFERLAQQYGAAGGELQPHIRERGGSVDEGGTVGGVAQRVWLQVRGLFGAASEHAILAACERGQDEVVARYRETLQSNLPLDLHALVQRQFEQAQRQHDHVKRLRDRSNAVAADQEQPA